MTVSLGCEAVVQIIKIKFSFKIFFSRCSQASPHLFDWFGSLTQRCIKNPECQCVYDPEAATRGVL